MRIGFIGCVQSSEVFLKTLLSISTDQFEVVAVVTKRESKVNADHVDLSEVCISRDIPYHFEDSSDRVSSIQFMKQYEPDVIYCFGWSYLLGEEMLSVPPKGVIGFHPAALPENRGRHPIIWALVLGLEKTASTFFKIDGGVDSGPILSQRPVNISMEDTARSLYEKILIEAKSQVEEFTLQLANGVEEYVEQDESRATYWRKRGPKDGAVDWRMQASDIHNLVRALSSPYPGAEFLHKEECVKLWRTEVCKYSSARNIEPGVVLDIDQENVLVKCGGDSAIWLLECGKGLSLRVGDYI